MTSGIEKAIKNVEEKYDLPDQDHEEEIQYEVFDWMSEKYQLMCREYRQSLGIVDMRNFESKYRTESEQQYWKNLERVRGYDKNPGLVSLCTTTYYEGKHVPIEIIPDPPLEYQKEWMRKHDLLSKESDAATETESEYQCRLKAWEELPAIRKR